MWKPERDDEKRKKKDKKQQHEDSNATPETAYDKRSHKRPKLDRTHIEIDDVKASETPRTKENKRRPKLDETHVETKSEEKPKFDQTHIVNNKDEFSEMPKKKKDRKKHKNNGAYVEDDEDDVSKMPKKKKDRKKNKNNEANSEDDVSEMPKKKKEKHKNSEANVEYDDEVSERMENRAMKSSGAMYGRGRRRGAVTTDARFAAIHSDPRFQRMPKHEEKVEVDARFARMFSDELFATGSAAPIDKRGKPRKGKQKQENLLLRHYLQEEEKLEMEKYGDQEATGEESGSELEREVSSEEDLDDSASDSDERSSTDEDDYLEYSVDGELWRYLMAKQEDTPMIDQGTHRLAVVNMDWDHIKAVDLYVVMTSCLPKGGQILSVAIYPTKFGLERMEVEATHGPFALMDTGESQSEDETEIDDQKFREYELDKLRYFFAVVVCDSAATANHIYETLDATEFMRTSNVFDLQVIPDSLEFDVPPREIATEAPANYVVPDYHTRALQHSQVKLSWEEDEPSRKKALRGNFNSNQLDDLDAFIASSGGETDVDDENEEDNKAHFGGDTEALPKAKAKRRVERESLLALLKPADGSDTDKPDDRDMEVTFNTGLEDISKRILEKKDKDSETLWKKSLRERSEKKRAKKKSKYSSDEDISDFDVQEAPVGPDDFFIDEPSTIALKDSKSGEGFSKSTGKRSQIGRERSVEMEEREATREELELLFADQHAENGLKGYNLKPKKVKWKKGKKELPNEDKLPDIDYRSDPRFSALSSSHIFALDPTDPQYKRSMDYAKERLEKQRKGNGK